MEENIFSLDIDSLSNVPEELLDEMTVLGPNMEQELRLVKLLKIAGRELTANELLIGMYRKFGVTMKRNILVSKMFRLKKKGLVRSAGKGMYKAS